MAEFNEGDVVQLKSGGPKMTIYKVEEWDGKMRAHCDWFEGTQKQSGSFYFAVLKLVEEPARRAQAGGKGGPWS
jgi:uncharacterized protein YodC (DUF2158 family)